MKHVIFNHPEEGIPDAEYMSHEEKTELLNEFFPEELRMDDALRFFDEIDKDQSGTLSKGDF